MNNNRAKRILVFSLISISTLLLVGFFTFIYLINTNYKTQNNDQASSNFIIVATGGSNRLLKGLDLIKQNGRRRMLLSGVGKGITKKDISNAILAKNWQVKLLDCCVDLDTSAVNTRGNAKESQIWLESFNAKSTFLVTANYHMPRLYMEFSRISPDIQVILIPVQPNGRPVDNFWHPKHAKLLTVEFLKYITKKIQFSILFL